MSGTHNRSLKESFRLQPIRLNAAARVRKGAQEIGNRKMVRKLKEM
jgi:hypothetical protein